MVTTFFFFLFIILNQQTQGNHTFLRKWTIFVDTDQLTIFKPKQMISQGRENKKKGKWHFMYIICVLDLFWFHMYVSSKRFYYLRRMNTAYFNENNYLFDATQEWWDVEIENRKRNWGVRVYVGLHLYYILISIKFLFKNRKNELKIPFNNKL